MADHFVGSHKSHFNSDPLVKYAVDHSFKLHPIQHKLAEATYTHPKNFMIGPTQCIQMCTCLIKQNNFKNVLDVGTFTGFSALSWALALPDDGRVITMDVHDTDYKNIGKRFIEESGVANKIDFRIQPALKSLDELIANGQSGKFDFAFLDADKTEYPQYYERCLQLVRSGGIIAVDNALFGGGVANPDKLQEPMVKGIDALNKIISNDTRVNSVLLPIEDGLHLAFKK